MSGIELNKKVPDFELPATGDKTIKLSDLAGKKVVLYFYPRASVSGLSQRYLSKSGLNWFS